MMKAVQHATANPLFEEAERLIGSSLPPAEFLRAVDGIEERIGEFLASTYGEYYGRLMALKFANFAVAKWHNDNRHLRVVARPVSLMFDPSNACQLACPGCVHSKDAQVLHEYDWPAGLAKIEDFRDLLRWVGPFAFNVVYFNYGEPLLNKNIADFVRTSNSYGLSSTFSTNLSLPFDVERFVASAPDYIILSIDGTTQDVYSFFRRKGNLDMALANVRKLVAAKKKLGQNRPRLSWRFFTFEHNVHQVDDAIRLATEFGVDEIQISTPYDVSEDPRVRVTTSPKCGTHALLPYESKDPDLIRRFIEPRDEVTRLFDESWVDRLAITGDLGPSQRGSSTCSWLYYSMTTDALSRVMPCCLAPSKTSDLVFGHLRDQPAEPNNLEGFRASRLAFADRERFDSERASRTGPEPFCAKCTLLPTFTHSPVNAIGDLRALDYREVAIGPAQEILTRLTNWG